MRFVTRPTAKAALLLGAGVLGLALWGLGGEGPSVSRPGVATLPTIKVAELEAEALKAPRLAARTDSEIEDEAALPVQQVVQVDRGDTLMDLLMKAGVERTEAVAAIDALKDVYNPRDLKAGQEVTVSFERPADGIGAGAFQAVVLQPGAGREVSATRAESGFEAREVKKEVTRQLARYSGTIRSSLFESASSAGVPAPVLAEMIRAFSYDIDFQRDIKQGDSFELMFERYVDKNGEVVRDGDMVFAQMVNSGTPLPVYRYIDQDGNADYYTDKGESVRKALLKTPVDGARISSGFGMRHHPILGYSKMHKGTDFSVGIGTPVYAAGSGVVEFAGAKGGYGYYLKIRHDDKHATAYGHLSRFAQGIRAGKRVTQGTIVAYSGNTGRSTGPHLHYEVLVANQQVNPLSIKFQSGTKLAGKDLARFQTALAETKRVFAATPVATRVAATAKAPTKSN